MGHDGMQFGVMGAGWRNEKYDRMNVMLYKPVGEALDIMTATCRLYVFPSGNEHNLTATFTILQATLDHTFLPSGI